jgi:hypothetical protein
MPRHQFDIVPMRFEDGGELGMQGLAVEERKARRDVRDRHGFRVERAALLRRTAPKDRGREGSGSEGSGSK